MRLLILGATGMLGNTCYRFLSSAPGIEVFASVRDPAQAEQFVSALRSNVIGGIDVLSDTDVQAVLTQSRPDVVVNCIGLVKQLEAAGEPTAAIAVNALLPHRLARSCDQIGARLVHVSTDCVFSGSQGHYKESDFPDALDLYGRSKLLGEVDRKGHLTLRTSIIGPELGGRVTGLVEWFLSQKGRVNGFTRARFSGVSTLEFATVLRDVVLPDAGLEGLYHLAADPVSKFDLLHELARAYGRDIEIVPRDEPVIDRSLDAGRFRQKTGYKAPDWTRMVQAMRDFR